MYESLLWLLCKAYLITVESFGLGISHQDYIPPDTEAEDGVEKAEEK